MSNANWRCELGRRVKRRLAWAVSANALHLP
jgi:hypothetical protein